MTSPDGRDPGADACTPDGGADCFAANLAAIALHSPAAASTLGSISPRPDFRLLRSTSGALSARVGQAGLHSARDPIREATLVVAEAVPEDATACVALGLGLGYLAEEVHRRRPDMPLAIVEPDLPLLVASLRARNLAPLLGSPVVRIYLASTPEEVAAGVEDMPLTRLAILAPASIRSTDPGYYAKVEAALRATADRKQINVNTVTRFGRLWIRNLLGNVASLVSSPGVASLSGRLAGIPSLVVAAGPSLDAVEEVLPELAERMALIAVDSSLATCMRAGVDPDVIVTVDPQYWNTRYFDRLRPASALLVCDPSTNPSSLRRLGLPTFFASSLFPLGKLLESVIGEKGRIGAGGSVATSAWDVARLMGSSPIALAGLDLGFPDGRTHARGLYFEELMATTATRTATVETQSHRYLTDAGSLRAPSTDGGVTRTDRRMLVYKWWFERQLAAPGAPQTRTLSPRGLRIEGMAAAPVDSLLALPHRRGEIRAALDDAKRLKPDPEAAARTRAAVYGVLDGLAADLEVVVAAAREGIRLAGRLAEVERRSRAAGSPSSRAELERGLEEVDGVDRRILERASREMAGFLMQRIINETVAGRRDAAGALEASRELYVALAESAELHATLVREALSSIGPR